MGIRMRVMQHEIAHSQGSDLEALDDQLIPDDTQSLTSLRASSRPSLPDLPFSRINSRTGAIAAFLHVSRRSDPDKPSALLAKVAMSKLGSSLTCASI